MLKALIWKEWREQRWKLAFGTVLLLFFAGTLAAARVSSDREIHAAVILCGSMLLALYSAMGVFAPERTEGTAGFLKAMPVQSGRVFLVKWFFGWLNIIVPVILTCGLMTVMLSDLMTRRGSLFYLFNMTVAGVWMATLFYTLTICLAPRRGGEGTVGITGLFIAAFIGIHWILFAFYLIGRHMPDLKTHGGLGNLLSNLILFLNPYVSLFINYKPEWLTYWKIMFWIEQLMLWAAVMWIGFRRWRRSG